MPTGVLTGVSGDTDILGCVPQHSCSRTPEARISILAPPEPQKPALCLPLFQVFKSPRWYPEQKVFLSLGGAILPKVQDKRSTNRSLQRPRALGFSAQNISEDYVCLCVPDSTRILKLTSKPRGYCPCHEQSSSSTLTVSPVSCWGFCRYCRIRTTTAIRMITTTMDLPFCSSLFLLRVLRPALPFSLDVFYSH